MLYWGSFPLLILLQLIDGTGEVAWRKRTHGSRRRLYDETGHVEYCRLYGDVSNYQYYFVDLEVGSPAQRVSVIVDTGSRLTGFPCSHCSSCGKNHIDPNYDISKSTTAHWLGCSESECQSRCEDDKCSYQQSYAEGSSISGHWFKDTVRIGDSFQNNPPVQALLGCHDRETNLFVTQKANGIMGMLDPKGSQKSSVLHALYKDKAHIHHEVFAMCLADSGGLLSVGGYNSSLHLEPNAPILWMKMDMVSFYAVSLTAAKIIGGNAISGNFGRTIVDSGTTFSYFPAPVYRSIIDGLKVYMTAKSIPMASEACLKNHDDLSRMPIFEFRFARGISEDNEGAEVEVVLEWGPEAYMTKEVGKMWTCPAFDSNGGDPSSVLGASFMKFKDVIFDVEAQRIAFPKANCPSFVTRPEQTRPRDETKRKRPFPTKAPKLEPTSTPILDMTSFTWLVAVVLFFIVVGALIICYKFWRHSSNFAPLKEPDQIGTVPDSLADDLEFNVTLGDSNLFQIDSDLEKEDKFTSE